MSALDSISKSPPGSIFKSPLERAWYRVSLPVSMYGKKTSSTVTISVSISAIWARIHSLMVRQAVRLAALLGAAVLTGYVPLAIWKGKLPFAASTEYEIRKNMRRKDWA